MENPFRSYSDGQLQYMLGREEYSHWDKVLIADLLLQKRLKITGLAFRYERLFQVLTRAELQQVDQNDFAFSKATVHAAIFEMKKRNLKILSWYVSKSGVKKGPMNRMELDKMLEEDDSPSILIWREGMKEWKKKEQLPHLSKPYFFDQEITNLKEDKPDSKSDNHSNKQKENQHTEYIGGQFNRPPRVSKKQSSSGTLILLALFQFISFPFWLFMIGIAFFTGFNSVTGPVLPFMFSIAMLILSIPVGIGMLGAKHWAYQIRLSTSVITIIWFAFRFFGDEAGVTWFILAVYDALLLGLLLANSRLFADR